MLATLLALTPTGNNVPVLSTLEAEPADAHDSYQTVTVDHPGWYCRWEWQRVQVIVGYEERQENAGRVRSVGGLYRWLRQIGHDGRLVQLATDQWRFSVWHGVCVLTSGSGSRRCQRRGSALPRSRSGWAGTAPRSSGSWPAMGALLRIGPATRRRRRAAGRAGPSPPSWSDTPNWPRLWPSASSGAGRRRRSALTFAPRGCQCARRRSTRRAMTAPVSGGWRRTVGAVSLDNAAGESPAGAASSRMRQQR